MGASMADTGGVIDTDYLYATSLTVAAKNLLCPIISYFVVILLGNDPDLASYAFIVGTFPIAPVVSIYGLRYSDDGKVGERKD